MTSSAGNSPPEGLFSRGGCHPCRVLAESEVVGEAREGRRIPGNPHRRFPSEQAKTGKQAGSPRIVRLDPSSSSASLSCIPDRSSFLFLRLVARFVVFPFVPSRLVSSGLASCSETEQRRSSLFGVITYREGELPRDECARDRSTDRSIEPTNRRTNRRTNERNALRASEQRAASERASTRERTRQGETRRFLLFCPVSGGTVPTWRTNTLRRTSIGLG